MEILSIELSGYKRLMLNNTNYIKINFKEKKQLILGTNGSGKSSLIKELSPLPGNSSDYLKEGFKKIIIRHNQSIYELESFFNPNKHYFKKDGTELNPGGTASVQKELCKHEFNITNEIHELLTGVTNFTSMSPSDRRYWFSQLCDTNYTYAISVYKKLNERLRDVVGAYKVSQTRLAQEVNKILTTEQETLLVNEIKELDLFINHLLNSKPNVNILEKDLVIELENINEFIKDSTKNIFKLRGKLYDKKVFNSIEQIDGEIINEQSELHFLENKILHLNDEHDIFNKQYQLLINNKVNSTSDLNKNIEEIEGLLNTLNSNLKYTFQFRDIDLAYQSFMSIYENLEDVFNRLPSNVDKRFSKVNYQNLTDKIQRERLELDNIKKEYDRGVILNNEQEHYRTHNNITCPQCSHKWIKDYKEDFHNKIKSKLSLLEENIKTLTTSISDSEKEFELMKEYFNLFKLYSDTCKSWNILSPLWDYFNGLEILMTNPRKISKELITIKLELERQQEIHRLSLQLNNYLELRKISQDNEQMNMESIQTKLSSIENDLFDINKKCQSVRSSITSLKQHKETIQNIQNQSIQLNTALNNQTKLYDDLINNFKRNAINELIKVVKLEQSKKEQMLSEANINKALVEDIQKQIIELEAKKESLQILVKELSPVDGLIAKGMLGFITNFTNQINTFIKKIWQYPMVIKSCKMEEEGEVDLDYKFEVVSGIDNTTPDISKCSSGMKEVIDLGFRLVAMKYLGLNDFPIFLDEFAKAMDSTHRKQAFYVITNLITQSNFTQIFIVSHYEDNYLSLSNSEILVLCSANVVIPQDTTFNQHVVIH